MSESKALQQHKYATLLIEIGVNLQPGQCLAIAAELAHAEMVRLLVAAAYDAGAKYVEVQWLDTLVYRARLQHSAENDLDYVPDFLVTQYRQYVDETWARLALVGPEFPDGLDDVAPESMRRANVARAGKLRFFFDAMTANKVQWCVAGVPTPAWAAQIYPDMAVEDAMAELWHTVLSVCRADLDDPVTAWQDHDANLTKVASFLMDNKVRTVHFVDTAAGSDGRPRSDLSIGLTDDPAWVAASSQRPDGVRFLPNMPTEEVFSTPHNLRTSGYVRTSKPAFPFERKVEDAYFRFEDGVVVEYTASVGQEVLDEFFAIDGAKQLGEVSLVDERSPINQAGVVFHETLFDENAVCHIAFGDAYPGGIQGGDEMERDALSAMGANHSDTHVDFMIGSPTMSVTGIKSNGETIAIMENGRFLPAVLA